VTTQLSAAARYTIVFAQKNRSVDISITRIIYGKAAQASSHGRSVLILSAAAALLAAGPALGQETIYIGGSGQTSVEINLGALDRYEAPRRITFGLRHPGVEDRNLAPVTLRPPSDAPRAEAVAPVERAPVDIAPVEMVSELEPPPAVKLLEPEPEPAARAERAPEPEQMTKEERAAAIARNKNMVSSTSFANELALGSDSNNATMSETVAEPTVQKSKAKPDPKTEMAALDPADVPTLPGQSMQIIFAAGEAALPAAAQGALGAIAAKLAQDDTLRLQLKAYAGGGADSASHARRLSLSRALAVRSHLIEQGVRSTRIDVRALGNKSESGTSCRVDVILVKR